ncbi:hypothetical protein AGABI2DRAFT_54171, partial [Agaricus bisporus var. bisporus H97]|uniref:hypothetical protein n=1 Tax=Agaricus bisporus var. bisporus (strain H97 / ATCC MYA-4626 / FGSC 10389) TaxID=936046 RepID=UPI00029F7CB3
LVWVDGTLSPQEICDRIVNNDHIFETKLVEYLQARCQGEFMTGTFQTVFDKFGTSENTINNVHQQNDPTLTLPTPPPVSCNNGHDCSVTDCENCQALRHWHMAFRETVDAILLKSNMHGCRSSFFGCMNKYGECTARFPRDVFPETVVDRTDGRIELRKREPMMNTFSTLLTYVLRCNLDVTCILTGTAVKALVAYITDYISKAGLNTHHVFKAAYDVLIK